MKEAHGQYTSLGLKQSAGGGGGGGGGGDGVFIIVSIHYSITTVL